MSTMFMREKCKKNFRIFEMLVITEKIIQTLKEKGFSRHKLSKLIDFNESSLNHMINGNRPFKADVLEKVSEVLEVSPEKIKGWSLADKYNKKALEFALDSKVKRTKPEKIILTLEIDERLKRKELSRTKLSKIISYSQGVLNEMIIGKLPISKTVIQRIAPIIKVSEDEIQAWIVADKYSLEAIKVAISCKH